MIKRTVTALMILAAAAACGDKIEPDPVLPPGPEEPDTNITTPPVWPEEETGKEYIWDEDYIPEFHIKIKDTQWDKLLLAHDSNPDISEFVRCDVIFLRNEVRDTISNVGIRLFDNGDAGRPEGKAGEKHNKEAAKWNFSNYELNFMYFNNTESNSLRKVRSVFLKSCVNDPSYARERYCYDLFRRAAIETVGRNIYCKVNIHVDSDENPAYLGIYQMIEPVDQSFIADRTKTFGNADGNLWKCGEGANLTSSSVSSGIDKGKGEDFTYTLITNQNALSNASAQLAGFMEKVKKLKNEEFRKWINEVCDVKLLLRTYAVIATIGMWDDYWNTGNNFYLYFNSTSDNGYKVYMIPYDFEMSLGNCKRNIMQDPGMQDPYNWGKNLNPLISRILHFPEYREIYREALMTLILPEAYLFQHETSSAIISDLMYRVSFYTKNDTGINMSAKDRTAHWSNTPQYTLIGKNDNFFKIRTEAIRNYSE